MGKLYAELKRRKVFRVAAVYAVVAWLLIQMADTIAPMMNLPEFTPRLVLFLLIVFFPISLFLAWAYEISPDGIHTDAGTNVPASSGSSLVTGLVILVIGLAGTGLYFFNFPGNDEPISQSGSTNVNITPVELDKSIAVLPFSAFSSNPDEQYFADGLSDTLLHKLAQLSDIRVISRTSSFQYRGESVDVRQVGNELNVATVLEGSVQRSGDQLRIIAQLVNTQDGGHIWSQTFDRSSEDIFAIHDEIADAVVQSLQVTMSPEEAQRLEQRGTASVEAYNLLTSIVERSRAVSMFELNTEEYKQQQYFWLSELDRVLEIDPNYAEVYRAKAEIYESLPFQAINDLDDAYHLRKGFEAVRQAMLLDPDNPRNFLVLAEVTRRSGDPASAEVFARMAVKELPNNASAITALMLSLSSQSKNPEEQLELTRRERELGVTGLTFRREMFALRSLGRLDEAEEVVRSQLTITDEPQIVINDLSNLLRNSGRHIDSMEALIAGKGRLENDLTDASVANWANALGEVGLLRERDEMLLRISAGLLAARQTGFNFFLQQDYAEGRAYLQSVLQEIPSAVLQTDIAFFCLMLGDFECTVANTLLQWPELESRNGHVPSFVSQSDMPGALALAVAYRKLDEDDAATRLLQGISAFYEDRISQGNVFDRDYSLPVMYFLLGDKVTGLQLMRDRIMLEEPDFIALCSLCSFSSPVYESVQDDPEFQELVTEYQRRQTASGARIQAMIDEAGY